MSDREKTMGALQRLFKRIEYAEQRAERAEAECERLREVLSAIYEGADDPQYEASEALATPPPEGEPKVATTFIGTLLVGDPFDERDGPWMDRKAWKRMNDLPPGTHIYASSEPLDAPHTPQAHRDALAALDRVREFVSDCEVGDTEPGTGKNEENREVEARLNDLDYIIRQALKRNSNE